MRRDYLFKRRDSQFWYVRFQRNGKSIERSLRTTDKAEARLLAAPFIAEHLQWLKDNRPKLKIGDVPLYPLGESTDEHGNRVVATADTAMIIGSDGKVRQQKNRMPFAVITSNRRLTMRDVRNVRDEHNGNRPKLATQNSDDAFIEHYITVRRSPPPRMSLVIRARTVRASGFAKNRKIEKLSGRPNGLGRVLINREL